MIEETYNKKSGLINKMLYWGKVFFGGYLGVATPTLLLTVGTRDLSFTILEFHKILFSWFLLPFILSLIVGGYDKKPNKRLGFILTFLTALISGFATLLVILFVITKS